MQVLKLACVSLVLPENTLFVCKTADPKNNIGKSHSEIAQTGHACLVHKGNE